MSVRIMTMVFDHCAIFDVGEKLLALKLADCANDDGLSIYPSVDRLAEQTNQSTRTVQRQLKRLQGFGWLLPVKYIGGGRGKATEYRIHPDFIAAHDMRRDPEKRPTWSFLDPSNQETIDSNDQPNRLSGDESKRVSICHPLGDAKGCHLKRKRVTPEAEKGDTGVTPTIRNHHRTNTPLPPAGGETAIEVDINALLAKLIEAHGRHRTSNTEAAREVLQGTALDRASSERMLSDLRAEVQSAEWQRSGGQFRPKLSKWLRGWQDLRNAGVQPASPPPSEAEVAIDQTRQLIASMGEGTRPPTAEVRERLRQLRAATVGSSVLVAAKGL